MALVLVQRGKGADAGAGFGAGASGTVFGARGASNFLTKTTKWLAVVFFTVSMGMAMYASKQTNRQGPAKADLGVMAQQPAPAKPAPQVPAAQIPTAPAQSAPAAQPAPAPAQGQ